MSWINDWINAPNEDAAWGVIEEHILNTQHETHEEEYIDEEDWIAGTRESGDEACPRMNLSGKEE